MIYPLIRWLEDCYFADDFFPLATGVRQESLLFLVRMVNTIYLFSFVAAPRKFIIAIINLRGV